MNTDTEKNINEALDWLQSTGGAIQDFASEQAPIYCREVVEWTFWMGATGTVMGLLLIVVAAVAMKVFFREIGENGGDNEGVIVASLFGGFIAAIMGLMILAKFLPDAIKAKVPPRLVIVEHLQALTK